MNRLRYGLMAAIGVVSYLLFLQWNDFNEQRKPVRSTETVASVATPEPNAISLPTTTNGEDLPTLTVANEQTNEAVAETAQAKLVEVTTPEFIVKIDTLGGDIVHLALRHHDIALNSNDPFILLNRGAADSYVAQSGLIGPNGTDKSAFERPVFSSKASSYELKQGQDSLVVDLSYQQDQVTLIKRFTFKPDNYLIDIDYLIQHDSASIWRAAPYGQIRRTDYPVPTDVGIGVKPFLGPAITTNEKNYAKFKFSKISEESVKEVKQGGWLALVQHYFVSAWIPDQEAENTFNLRKQSNSNLYIFEYVGPVTTVEAGQNGTLHSEFYAGPKNLRTMAAISPHLELTIDYGFLWFIAKPLFFALDWIHGLVGNWGVAIILLTLCIKLVFFYPSAMSYRSMAKMRKLQPLMADLKEQYGDDKQKMSAELMKVYKKEKVNPLGGCLPILMQMPVFISLYWMLMESVELRHAPFILWIQDLSIKDPHFILPLIMGFTMFIQQKLNPTPPDPMQAKVMQWLPVFFTLMFLMFPAGLVLYWIVNNTLSIAQQYFITRQIERGTSK